MYPFLPTGVQLILSLHFKEDEDQEDVKVIGGKLYKVIIGQTNMIYKRYMFNNQNQKPEETVDKYVNELNTLSKNCEFRDCMKQQLKCDHLVVGVKDTAVRKLLLQKRDLTVEKAIDICQGDNRCTIPEDGM